MRHKRIKLHGIRGKGKYALVDGDYDGELLSRYTWYVNPNGYVVRRQYKWENEKGVHGGWIYLHRAALGRYADGKNISHINGNRLDCRGCNLRILTKSQITYNRKRCPGFVQKYKGVMHSTCVHTLKDGTKKSYVNRKFIAVFNHKYLGSYETEEDAARRWNEEAYKHYGEYGVYNIIKGEKSWIKRLLKK